MEKELLDFLKWLQEHKDNQLPSYESLPSVPLYMEQVVGYVNDILAPITGNEKGLTPFMVNNYVKAKIIEVPEGKKYNADHLGYLLAITLLKSTLSMDEIAMLISLDDGISTDKSKLYRFFSSLEHDINNELSNRLYLRLEDYYQTYKKTKKWPTKGKKAESDLRDSLGFIALRMAVYSTIYQRLSKRLLEIIGTDLYGEEGIKVAKNPSPKEGKEVAKAEEHAAKRIGFIQALAAQRAKEKANQENIDKSKKKLEKDKVDKKTSKIDKKKAKKKEK